MECGDKSPLSKAVPRHCTPKNGVFKGGCPPLKLTKGGKGAATGRDSVAGAG